MSLEEVYIQEGPECEDSDDDEEEAVLLQVEDVKEECESAEASEAGVLAGLYTSHVLEEVVVLEPEEAEVPTHGMVMQPRARANYKQYATLVGFMERHSDIARLPPGCRLWGDRLWQQLVTTLNAVPGGVYKPPEKWKKVWADWKANTKKKAIILRKNNAAKGPLNVLEKRVLGVMKPTAYKMADLEKGFIPPKISAPPKDDNVAHGGSGQSEAANAGDAYSTASALGAPPTPCSRQPRPAPAAPHPRPAPDTPNTANSQESLNAPTSDTHPPSSFRHSTTTSATTSRSTATSHLPTSPPANRRSLLPRVSLAEALNNFTSIERRRLKLDEIRERNLHAREREKLRLERERLRVEREKVDVFRHLAETAQDLLAHFTGGSQNHAREQNHYRAVP